MGHALTIDQLLCPARNVDLSNLSFMPRHIINREQVNN